jgi:hypothetical protein
MTDKDSMRALIKIASSIPPLDLDKFPTEEEMMEFNMGVMLTQKILFEPESKFSRGIVEHIKKQSKEKV